MNLIQYVPLFFLGVLATTRLTILITEDEITRPLRERIWAKYPPATTQLGYLFTCAWCSSIYAATFITLSYILLPYITIAISCILALSYLAAILQEVRHR